jgi:DNA invertase Pin-like site-specific DNA recombinase
MALAAIYIRTDTEGELPTYEEQRSAAEAYAEEQGHEVVAEYTDLDATGFLLYYRPGIKEVIHNIKEREEWETLIVAHPRAISDDETALHEFVHKFSLYNNSLESPHHSWEEFLEAMRVYRRAMSRRQ